MVFNLFPFNFIYIVSNHNSSLCKAVNPVADDLLPDRLQRPKQDHFDLNMTELRTNRFKQNNGQKYVNINLFPFFLTSSKRNVYILS